MIWSTDFIFSIVYLPISLYFVVFDKDNKLEVKE